jgi:hypothetical protein
LPDGVFAKVVAQFGETRAAKALNAFFVNTATRAAGIACGLKIGLAVVGKLIWDSALGYAVMYTVGKVVNRFYDVLVPPEDVDNGISRNRGGVLRPQGTSPQKLGCRVQRIKKAETDYAYKTKYSANWNDVQLLIGQPTKVKDSHGNLVLNLPPLRDISGNIIPNKSRYFFAEIEDNGDVVRYAYLPDDNPNKEVPLLITAKNEDKWNIPSDKSPSSRIAADKRYTDNHDAVHRRLITQKRNIHHLLADNVWREEGMLQEILERCAGASGGGLKHMDVGQNLIELASDVTSLNDARTAHGNRVANIIHNTSHSNYDGFAVGMLRQNINSGLFNLQNDPNTIQSKLQFKNILCSEMVKVVEITTTQLRDVFLTDTLPMGTFNFFQGSKRLI